MLDLKHYYECSHHESHRNFILYLLQIDVNSLFNAITDLDLTAPIDNVNIVYITNVFCHLVHQHLVKYAAG